MGLGRWHVTLRRDGHEVGRKRVRRLMSQDGSCANLPASAHDGAASRAPDLSATCCVDLVVDRPNQVWCADITYIPMRRGFLYLVAVMDWGDAQGAGLAGVEHDGRGVLRIEALREALARFGRPEIFNTDQGSQFTSDGVHGRVAGGRGAHLDGRPRALDG